MAEYYTRQRLGDRREGHMLRNITAEMKLGPFVSKNRGDCCNFFEDSVDTAALDRWLRTRQNNGMKGLGMLHVFVAAYVRSIAHKPGLNRFVSGHRLFARNSVDIIMLASRSASRDSEMATVKVVFDASDTIYDIYRKINEVLDVLKAQHKNRGKSNFFNSVVSSPRFIARWGTKLLRLFDYFGFLPVGLIKKSPYHGSLLISDVGSYGSTPIFLHLPASGNIPVSISIGRRRAVRELDSTGNIVERRYVDYGVVMDNRIEDPAYFSSAFKFFKYYLANPSALETPPDRVEEDIL